MDAGGAGFLRQAGNQLLNLFARHHHQIGELVHHHHDKRQFFQRLGVVGREAERVGDFFAPRGGFGDFFVIARQVAHAHMAHQAIAFFHFVHAPVKRVGGVFHIGYHGGEQVRDVLVHRKFQHFRVYHNQAHIFGRGFVEHGQNHAVHAHRFARSCGARHQQMRGFGKVGYHGLARDVFAQRKGEFAVAAGKRGRVKHFAQADGLAFGVGQFQPHAGFAWDGFHHADGGYA